MGLYDYSPDALLEWEAEAEYMDDEHYDDMDDTDYDVG